MNKKANTDKEIQAQTKKHPTDSVIHAKSLKKSLSKTILSMFLVLTLVSVTLVCLLGYLYIKNTNAALEFDEQKIYSIEKGHSIRHFSNQLLEDGVINENYSLRLMARTEFANQHIKAGDYQFKSGQTLKDVMQKIIDGDVLQYKVTLLEGWTFKQFRDALKTADINQSIDDLTDDDILKALNLDIDHPEGWFYPDTYIFTRADNDLDILQRAYTKMKEELDAAWLAASDNLSPYLKTKYDALILASIIERETSIDDEREMVSSVFHNRMAKGMRLQTDPTIIYGLGDDFDGNLRRVHIDDASNIYNTYQRDGLTPTPISMPSKSSIYAALNPVETDYLYFVATGNGGHKFSKTYKEHQQAIREYHKVLRKKQSEELSLSNKAEEG